MRCSDRSEHPSIPKRDARSLNHSRPDAITRAQRIAAVGVRLRARDSRGRADEGLS